MTTPYLPLISVVMVALNEKNTLEGALNSVLSQTYEKIELIIIDGGSTDGTLEIIRRYAHKIAYWVSEPDGGVSDAFNKGAHATAGDLVIFLNADDLFANDQVVARVVEEFRKDPTVSMLYGKAVFFENELHQIYAIKGKPFDGKQFRKYMTVPHQALFVQKLLLNDPAPFSVQYKLAMDYDFVFRNLSFGIPRFFDHLIVLKRKGGLSDQKKHLGLLEFFKIQRSHGVSYLHAISALVQNFGKYFVQRVLEKARLKSMIKLYFYLTKQL